MGVENIISAEDMARYRELIRTVELSDEQRDEIIEIVHQVMQSFVDISFDQDSVQIGRRDKLKGFFEKADSANLHSSSGLLSHVVLPRGRAERLEP